MRAALMAHDEVLRTAIEAHDGFLFSHTGDGVVAAFASPTSAVDAAVAAQRALELPVRMGLATGEAELRDGDYFGTVLNRAARVMAAGHGGQILVADSTAVLLSGVDLVRSGAATVAGPANPGGGVPGPCAGPAHGLSAVAGTGYESGKPAACGHQLHRARVRSRRGASGAANTSAGDVDRGGRGRQDPANVAIW